MDEQQAPAVESTAIEKTLGYALAIVSDGIRGWGIARNHFKRSPGCYNMLGYPLDGLWRGEPLEDLLRRLDDALYLAKIRRDCAELC